jgi:hypothetical protein
LIFAVELVAVTVANCNRCILPKLHFWPADLLLLLLLRYLFPLLRGEEKENRRREGKNEKEK